MKIAGPDASLPVTSRHGERVGSSQPKAIARQEKVEVSAQAHSLQQARAPETPDVDKVTQLRESIAAGTFVINVEKIAERMMQEEQ